MDLFIFKIYLSVEAPILCINKNMSPDTLEYGCSDSASYLLVIIVVLLLLIICLVATNIFLTVRRKKGKQFNIFMNIINFQLLFIVVVNYGGSPQITIPFRTNPLGKIFHFSNALSKNFFIFKFLGVIYIITDSFPTVPLNEGSVRFHLLLSIS